MIKTAIFSKATGIICWFRGPKIPLQGPKFRESYW